MTGTDCAVCWAHVGQLRAEHLTLLDDVEHGRMRAYEGDDDRRRFALGAILLRCVVARRVRVAPAEVHIERGCSVCGAPHGRPRLPLESLEVSVTHSGQVAGVAVSTAGRVGVDVELMRPVNYAALIDDVCAPLERATVADARGFFSYWTRKEAVLKATGDGLARPMPSVWVTPPDAAPKLLGYAGNPLVCAQMSDFTPARGYVGALAVLNGAPVTVSQTWAHLPAGGCTR